MLGASSQNGAALLQWMHALLTKLLFGDAMSVELVHIASELTLALILCYEQPFHALVRGRARPLYYCRLGLCFNAALQSCDRSNGLLGDDPLSSNLGL
eukprot:COSAG01_NODE_12735_length_1692_cov_14.765494_1_plen_98_part_00